MFVTCLDQEQPSPSFQTVQSAELQKARGQESGDNVGEGHGRPEKSKTQRQLTRLVEIAEVQNDLSVISFYRIVAARLSNIRRE